MPGQQAQASLTVCPPRLPFPQQARVYPQPYLQAKNRQAAILLVSRDPPAVKPVARDQLRSHPVAKALQEASTLKARPSLLR